MEKKPRKPKIQPQKPVEKKEVPNQPVEKKPAKKVQLSLKAERLIGFLKKCACEVGFLTKELDMDSHTLYDLAQSLKSKGHDIKVKDIEGNKTFILASGDNFSDEAISIEKVNKKFKVAIISEIRMGAKQAQISLLHWMYKEIFEKQDVDFVVIAGGLVIGKPTRTLLPDAILTDPDELINYVVKNFPKSDKFKTYIVPGKGELSWGKNKEGVDIISAICKSRSDLKMAAGANEGELEKDFKIKDVVMKVTAHFEDNSPKSVSNGPQNIANRLTKDNKNKSSPLPDILVVGQTHRRSFLPVYNGMYIVTPPSMHMQMRRQRARKVSVYVGCTILELNYNQDWTIDLGKGGLKVHQFRLDDYVVKNDCYSVDFSKSKNLGEEEKMVLEWLSSELIINAGDIARRLKKSKETVEKIIEKLVACGYAIEFGEATKAYEFKVRLREKFSPLPLKYEDVFVWATKEAGISDPHLGSKEDLPDILKTAYEDAAREGCRRVNNAGDIFDGPGASGYRGHVFDVKCPGLDDMEDYGVANWPKVEVEVQKKPLLVTEIVNHPNGRIGYKETFAKVGSKVFLQTDAVEGNHEVWAWQSIGHKMVRALAIRISNLIRYLGNQYGTAFVDNIFHVLIHPASSGGEMLSNVVEKHLRGVRESKEDDNKPTVVYIGHLHSAYYLFDTRYGIRLACVKRVDQFHKTHALVPYIGMSISEMFTDKEGRGFTQIIMEYRNYRPMVRKEEEKKNEL